MFLEFGNFGISLVTSVAFERILPLLLNLFLASTSLGQNTSLSEFTVTPPIKIKDVQHEKFETRFYKNAQNYTANDLSAVSTDYICVLNSPSVGCNFSRHSFVIFYRFFSVETEFCSL